jgi:hypothetical protein
MFAQMPFERRAGEYTNSIQTIQEWHKASGSISTRAINKDRLNWENVLSLSTHTLSALPDFGTIACRGSNRIQTLEGLAKKETQYEGMYPGIPFERLCLCCSQNMLRFAFGSIQPLDTQS